MASRLGRVPGWPDLLVLRVLPAPIPPAQPFFAATERLFAERGISAVVDISDPTGGPVDVDDIQAAVGFDARTVQRALRALNTEPFFRDVSAIPSGDIWAVSATTGSALRVAGAWPSSEALLEGLVDALELAAGDQARESEERSKFRTLAVGLRSFATQVAIGALSGAGGNLLAG